MQANSEKISSKQLFYLLTLELFCLITLFLPEFLSNRLAQDAPVGLVLGFVFACAFGFILILFWRKYSLSFLQNKGNGGIMMDAMVFLLFIQTVLITVFVLNITWEIVQMFLLPEVDRFVILIVFYLVCVFASSKKMEVRARMAEFCGRFFAVLFIILLAFSVKKIDLNQYETLFMNSPVKLISGGYEVFLLFESLIFSLFAATFLNKKTDYSNALKKSLLCSVLFGLAMLLVLMGSFGVNYIGVMDYPAIRLLRNITKGGGFLSRMDVLMIGVWLFSLFFFVSGGLQYAGMLLSSVLDDNTKKSVNIVLFTVIFLIAWIFGNMQNSYYIYRNYMYFIGTPLILVVLIILLLKKSKDTQGVNSDE